jgi:5'-nucleotidase / UDP-sugar diphosphatase
VDKIRSEEKSVLVVDSGLLFTDARALPLSGQEPANARLISRVYKRMGVAAVNVGDLDLMQGLPFLRLEASRGLPLISANLIDPSGKPIFPSYVIIKVDKMRVAFFGLLSPDINPAIRKAAGKDLIIEDPTATARNLVNRLRSQADIVVLLSDLGLEKDRELLKAVPGIHFILGGHEGQFVQSPIWENNTPILQSYKKGMYAGKLQLFIENGSTPFREEGRGGGNRFRWTLIPLDGSFKEDKTVSEWIQKAGDARDSISK